MIEGRSDLWHVQLASGDLEILTLDQLDDAFQNGRIDERTMVLQGGGLTWSRLGDILGDDAGVDEAVAAPRQVAAPHQDIMAPSVRPLAYDVAPSAHSVGLLADDDFDPDLVSLRPSKKKFAVIGLAAVLLLAIGAVGISKIAGSPAVEAAATQANVVSAVAAAQPAAGSPQPSDVTADSAPGSRLSDDQRHALAGLDKKLEDAQKAKANAAAAKATKHSHFKSKGHGKSGLHNGGDAHDPLNASLN